MWFDAVLHFAAQALIDEAIRDPGRLFRANLCGSLNLIDAMVAARIDRLVFSFTAAMYGAPVTLPITENSGFAPVNSYGEFKLALERVLERYRIAYGLKYVSLGDFNAAEATEPCGEYHMPETILIPIIFESAIGQRPEVHLFGTVTTRWMGRASETTSLYPILQTPMSWHLRTQSELRVGRTTWGTARVTPTWRWSKWFGRSRGVRSRSCLQPAVQAPPRA